MVVLAAVTVLCAPAAGLRRLSHVDVPGLMRQAAAMRAPPGAAHRRLSAQQASASGSGSGGGGAGLNVTCTGFADALAALTANCTGIAQYTSGAVSQEQFLGSFCSSGCSAQVQGLFSAFGGCIPGSSIEAVAHLTVECDKRPECYSAAVLPQLQDVFTNCFTPLTNLTDLSAAAQAAVAGVCTNGCVSNITALANSHPQCFGEATGYAPLTASNITAFVSFLCSTASSANDTATTTGSGSSTAGGGTSTCAWNLRSLGRLDCASNPCGGSNTWCSVNGSGACVAAMTEATLSQLCSPCLLGLVNFSYALGTDPVYLNSLHDLYCSRAANATTTGSGSTGSGSSDTNATAAPFCLPLVQSAFSSPSADSVCDGASGSCIARYGQLLASLTSSLATATFTACMQQPFGLLGLCQPALEHALAQAQQYREAANLVCARNGNGTRCWGLAQTIAADSCYFSGLMGLCPSGCLARVQNLTGEAGCCLPAINDYLRTLSSSFTASYLPCGAQTAPTYTGTTPVTYTRQYAYQGVIPRSLQPLNAFAQCANTSALWSAVEGECAVSSSGVARRLKLALAWNLVNNATNAGLYELVLSSLRADVANLIGCDVSAIKQLVLAAEDSISVPTPPTTGTTTSGSSSTTSGSGSQHGSGSAGVPPVPTPTLSGNASGSGSGSAASSAGCSFSFYIDAGAAAATSALAAVWDRLAAGTMRMSNTAATCSSQCPRCVASPVSSGVLTSTGEAAAAGPGGSGSGPSTAAPFSPSSASPLPVALATTAVALALALVA